MARRFKHLTKTDRLRMEQQLKDGKGAKEIAENLGVHISTIYRERKNADNTSTAIATGRRRSDTART